jgi:predicted GH43/DUF377 family glycosyl hydrolase
MDMVSPLRRFPVALLAAVAGVFLAAPAAHACSVDDTAYFDGFLDAQCLTAPLQNTTIDTFGGLRLTTNGAPTTTPWDTNADFDTGITYQSKLFGPVGAGTLARNGTGTGATLQLPTTSLPLFPDGTNPVLSQTPSTVLDGDNVDDPSVVRNGSGLVMWFAGTAEDGRGPAIFRATSTDGKTWVRSTTPVLLGTPSTFDARGVFGPHVIYNAADAVAPYRMYYSGKGDVFGSIGYATSTDGITWTKRAEGAVLEHGQAGSPDSFAAADPSVFKDGATWKMWYTGDDSTKKRIAYATSSDGITWAKGGKVISPEDPGANANYQFGAFAPSVYKTGDKYRMLLVGRKEVGGGVFQTKVMSADSNDGIAWTAPSPSVNPSGTNSKFDFSNLNGPFVVADATDSQAPYKLYYSGNTVDANGNFHTRIGYATSNNGTSFSKVTTGVNADNSVLDIGALGTAFDGRQASGLSVVDTGGNPKYVGAYWGTRGSDFKPRLGQATSADGSTWTKVPGTPAQDGASLLALGNNAAFDNGGQRDPALLKDTDYHLYFTGLSSGGVRTIGYATATAVGLPTATWTKTSTAIVPLGSGFDGTGVAHPSVLKDGATYHLWYTGYNGTTPSIGHLTSSSVTLGSPSGRAEATFIAAPTLSAYEAGGRKDPVVIKDGATYRMLYTGIDADKVERLLYATSSDGLTWTRGGPVLNPSQQSYAFDEVAVGASGYLLDGATAHVWTTGTDRTGRTRGGHAQSATTATNVPSGWSTYQLGDATTAVRDFRAIARTSTGADVRLWMSFLQPYSSGSSEYWSDYFPVAVDTPSETLNFLLTVRGVRWQARLADTDGASGTGNPVLDKVELTHAPVSFSSSGSALTTEISPPAGQSTLAWGNLEVAAETFAPNASGAASGTVVVLDATGATQLASQALTLGQTTTLSLNGIDPAVHKTLRVRFDLASGDGAASPLVRSLKILFNALATPPPPPPPPPAPILTLTTPTPIITYGQQVTLAGNLLQAGAPLAARAVTLTAAPASPVTGATTDAAGKYATVHSPSANTTYSATSAGVLAPPSVSVGVRHAVVLKATRRLTKTGAKVVLRGTLGPAQPGHPIVIERRSGSRWVKYLTTKATSTSTISASKAIKRCAKYTFRAVVPADATHLDNASEQAQVELHRVALKASVRGRKVTLTGSVAPKHGSGTVIVRRKSGTKFVTFAKVKISKRSTFRLVKTVKKGKYTFRADKGSDSCHYAGVSRERSVTVR